MTPRLYPSLLLGTGPKVMELGCIIYFTLNYVSTPPHDDAGALTTVISIKGHVRFPDFPDFPNQIRSWFQGHFSGLPA